MQNKWLSLSKELTPLKDDVVVRTNQLADLFRKNNWPLFFVTLEHSANGATLSLHDKNLWNVSGSEEAMLISDLRRDPSDNLIVKHRYSCFHGTELLKSLKEGNVSKVLICGYQLSACVLATALDAYQFDFQPLVVADCVLDTSQKDFDFFIDYFKRAECLTSSNEWLEKTPDGLL